ncbi:MAG: 3-dehydroquinate dehydratase [Flavobacteriales bacterium]|nr:3-dehydroquinate dehydratase [Flavobacteriales bacterium]
MNVIIINGPNLNLLGVREKSIYGNISFEEYFKKLVEEFPNLELEQFQSNLEGELIDKLQEVGFTYDAILLNAGGYTHTSVAISDCIKSIETPVIEIHISNIYSREDFRQKSLLSENCKAIICGLGLNSYKAALTILQ